MTLERPRAINQEEPLYYRKEKERSRTLSRVYRILRNFVIAGVLIGGYSKTSEIVFEYQAQTYYQEVEKLKKTDQELKETFGTDNPLFISEKIAGMEEALKGEKRRHYLDPRPPRIVECPFCNRFHGSSHQFCPYYGLSLAPEAIKKSEEEKEKAERQRVLQTTDIETREGKIEKQRVKEYLDTLPEGWVSPSVKSIIQTQKQRSSIREGEEWSTIATCTRSPDGAKIELYGKSREYPLDSVMETIGHEVAHANDWKSERIRFENRLNLLMKIAQRIKANDRYKSAYVESIKENNPHKTNYTRATEYWATISEQYFSTPWELNIEDFLIVDDYIKRISPNYNWKGSFEDRLKVIEKVRQDISLLKDNPSLAQDETSSFQNQ